MENVQAVPVLGDLVRILYQPRQTMRRILDSGSDRWALQVAFLAAICASINETDLHHAQDSLPSLPEWTTLALAALGILFAGAVWVGALFVISWIVTLIGRVLGGVGTVADVRAALAWSLVPVIWSAVYRIPQGIYISQFHVGPNSDPKAVIFDFLAKGGCAVAVVSLMFRLIIFVWFLFVGSNTLAEALRFSPWKGLASLALVIAVPLVLTAAAVIAFQIT